MWPRTVVARGKPGIYIRYLEPLRNYGVWAKRRGSRAGGPEKVPSCHTLSGQVEMDVGDVVQIEIEPRWNPQRVKWRRQEVQQARR